MFRLTAKEDEILRSQIVTSSKKHGGRRYPPYAFTEHGAIMAATVLNSKQAIEMSVFVVRAFVRMREMLAKNRQLAAKINELDRRLETHDTAIQDIIEAIKELMAPGGALEAQDRVSASAWQELNPETRGRVARDHTDHAHNQLFPALAVQSSVYLLSHGLDVQRNIQKLRNTLSCHFRFAQHGMILHAAHFHVGLAIEPAVDVRQVVLKRACHHGIVFAGSKVPRRRSISSCEAMTSGKGRCMKMTRYSCFGGSESKSCEITFTALPSASAMQVGSLGNCLMRSHSRYPRGLSTSARRSPSERIGMPPAASICIISDVPERGKPETIVIMSSFRKAY